VLSPSYIRSMARAKHGSYLFQRDGSDNWWIKLRSPGEKRKEHSLRTPDRREAEILAGPLVTAHKTVMCQRRPTVTPFWHRAYEPACA